MTTLRFAQLLDIAHEAIVGFWSQSNGLPLGLRDSVIGPTPFWAAPYLKQATAGQNLTISDITGSIVTVSETLVASAHVGQEIRIILPLYGESDCPAHIGKGLVTANDTGTLTVTWDVSPVIPTAATGGFTFAASNKVAYTAHPYENGDRVVFTGAPLGAGITAGVTYFVINKGTNDFELSVGFGGATLTFSTAGAGATITPTIGAYVFWASGKGMSYSNVRSLIPYTTDDGAVEYPAGVPVTPGVTWPTSLSNHEDAALFLPFTFNDGVAGFGIAKTASGITYSSAASKGTLTDTNLALKVDILKGATFQIVGEKEIMTVESNTDTVITFTTDWTGAAPAAEADYEGHVHHYHDNPHSWTYGQGFRYAHQWMVPSSSTYCRPRGRLTSNAVAPLVFGLLSEPIYPFGPLLPLGWRMSSLMGRRINLVPLGYGGARLSRIGNTLAGAQGWLDASVLNDWMPDGGNNLAERYRRMWEVIVPIALAVDGSTGRGIGIVGFQGESDGNQDESRDIYGTMLAGFYAWHRKFLQAASLSAYDKSYDIPAVHAQVNAFWSGTGSAIDPDGVINAAILDWGARDRAGATIDVSASALGVGGHFDGQGMALNGQLAADALVELVSTAAQISADDASAVRICNRALHHIGDKGRIESLDPAVDASTQARVCAEHYPSALAVMFEEHSWKFATRKVVLTSVTCTNPAYTYAYAIPADCADAISVLPEGATDDFTFPEATTKFGQIVRYAEDAPVPFAIEVDNDGYEVIFTDLANAHLRYTRKVNASIRMPAIFETALSWQLASMISGTLVKGDGGRKAIRDAEAMAAHWRDRASAQDSEQRENDPPHMAPWDKHR